MPRVFLIGGEKGGTGKSFVARTLIQYFIDNGIRFAAIDADTTNPDVKDIYSELVTEVRFSEDDYRNNPYNIYTLAVEQPVVVNLPAGVYEPLKDWLIKAETVRSAQADGVSFCHFLVTNGMYDSLVPCIKVLETMGEVIPHVLVKNLGAGRDWDFYKSLDFFQDLLQKYTVKEIDFPELQALVVNQILQSRLTYSQYLNSPSTSAGMKPLVRGFLRKAYAAFESTGLMPTSHPDKDESKQDPLTAQFNAPVAEKDGSKQDTSVPQLNAPVAEAAEVTSNGNSKRKRQTAHR